MTNDEFYFVFLIMIKKYGRLISYHIGDDFEIIVFVEKSASNVDIPKFLEGYDLCASSEVYENLDKGWTEPLTDVRQLEKRNYEGYVLFLNLFADLNYDPRFNFYPDELLNFIYDENFYKKSMEECPKYLLTYNWKKETGCVNRQDNEDLTIEERVKNIRKIEDFYKEREQKLRNYIDRLQKTLLFFEEELKL